MRTGGQDDNCRGSAWIILHTFGFKNRLFNLFQASICTVRPLLDKTFYFYQFRISTYCAASNHKQHGNNNIIIPFHIDKVRTFLSRKLPFTLLVRLLKCIYLIINTLYFILIFIIHGFIISCHACPLKVVDDYYKFNI